MMSLLTLALLSPTPQNDKPDLPPLDVKKEVVVTFKLEPVLWIKVSGQGQIVNIRDAIQKLAAEHKMDTIMMYSDDFVPVLIPKQLYEKEHKDNPHFISVDKLLEEAKKSAEERKKATEELEKQKTEEPKPESKT